MRRMITTAVLVLAGALFAQEATMTLATARGKIDGLIANPKALTAVMKQLPAADQTAFLADVNAAIAKMPGSTNEKTAKFLDVNIAALKGAQPGNMTTLLAEVFATVPPNALTVINERFASDVFNRAADPSKTYTDKQFTAISQAVLAKVQERTASADNAGVRNTFAILMLVRASNGSPDNLKDTLVSDLKDQSTRDLAKNEWIPPALAEGAAKSYDPMLGASNAGAEPNAEVVMSISYLQGLDALIGDLAFDCGIADSSQSLTGLFSPSFDDPLGGAGGTASLVPGNGTIGASSTVPRWLNANTPFDVSRRRGDGYAGQTLK